MIEDEMAHRKASVYGQNAQLRQALKTSSFPIVSPNVILTTPSKDGNGFNGTKYISKIFFTGSGIKWTCEYECPLIPF